MIQLLHLLGRHDEAAVLEGASKNQTARKPIDVEFDLDVSGSMSGAPIVRCRNSLETIICDYLSDTDTISLVTFSGTTRSLFSQVTKGRDLPFIIRTIRNDTEVGGGTAFYDALMLSLLRTQESSWVVALTDGEDNAHGYKARDVVQQLQKAPRNVIIITVGAVSTRNEIMTIIRAANTKTTKGIFIEIGRNDKEIENAFQKVANLILGELHVDSL